MKKYIFFTTLSTFLIACSQKDEAFCECLKANDALNEETIRLMESDEVLGQDDSELKALRKTKDEVCAPYETMGGEELKKLQEACK
jgi:fatty acid/phospholipid biosynthesis enzyme